MPGGSGGGGGYPGPGGVAGEGNKAAGTTTAKPNQGYDGGTGQNAGGAGSSTPIC